MIWSFSHVTPNGPAAPGSKRGYVLLSCQTLDSYQHVCKCLISVSVSCRSLRCSSYMRLPKTTPASQTAPGCCTKQAQGTLTQTYKLQAPPAVIALLAEAARFLLVASFKWLLADNFMTGLLCRQAARSAFIRALSLQSGPGGKCTAERPKHQQTCSSSPTAMGSCCQCPPGSC